MMLDGALLEGAGNVCGGVGWSWKRTLVKVIGMFAVMMMMKLEVYLGEGDGDVVVMMMKLEVYLGEGDGDVGGDDDEVGSVPW